MGHSGGMSELRLAPNRAITEDDLAHAQPTVRALIHERLEDLWADCEAARMASERPDPRWGELGLRILKMEAELYRLGRPQPVTPGEDDSTPKLRAIEVVRADMARLAS
jgi:hypothetical protein